MNEEISRALESIQEAQKQRNYSVQKCQDQIVGIIKKEENGEYSWEKEIATTQGNSGQEYTRTDVTSKSIGALEKSYGRIIIILESPHDDEYNENHMPIGPAYGKTGQNINKYFCEILNDFQKVSGYKLQSQKYYVILVNAIQKQCSLGMDPLVYRDIMFLSYWEKDKWRDDFICRLRKSVYGGKDSFIINCCTRGKHSNSSIAHRGSVCKTYLKKIGFSNELYLKKYTLQALVTHELGKKVFVTIVVPIRHLGREERNFAKSNKKMYL